MKKVVITGADGFVGSYTVKCFLKNNIGVVALDLAEKPARLEQHPLLTYKNCDVFQSDALKKAIEDESCDTFIHFAWAGSAGPGRMDYNLQMKNALNTVESLKIAKQCGCKRFLGAGSIMEYEVEAVVHQQGNKPSMAYLYGMGKHIAHSMCKPIAAAEGIDLLWPMITNAYGVGELSPRFINTTLRKIIHGEPLEFTAATQNYDFVYVEDVAKAFYLIAEKGRPFCQYMIGSGRAGMLREFIVALRDATSPDTPLKFGDIPFTGVNMSLQVFSTYDIEKDCGYQPEVSFEEGVKRTMDWLKTMEESDI